jgi:dipeptidyl-peptidase 4
MALGMPLPVWTPLRPRYSFPLLPFPRLTVGISFAFLATLASSTLVTTASGEDSPHPAKLPRPQTVAEASEFRAAASHAELMQFCETIAEQHSHLKLLSIGNSAEGRSIPALVLRTHLPEQLPQHLPERQDGATAEGAADRGLVTMLVGGLHGDQCESTESLMATVRNLADSPMEGERQHGTLVVIPRLNVDGAERRGPHHRPEAPVPAEVGRRPNAQEIDLDRDFVDLRAAETRHLVRFLHQWQPHFLLELRTAPDRRQTAPLRLLSPQTDDLPANLRDWITETATPQLRNQLRHHGLLADLDHDSDASPAKNKTKNKTENETEDNREEASDSPSADDSPPTARQLLGYAPHRGIATFSGEISLRLPYAQRIETGSRFLDLAITWGRGHQETLRQVRPSPTGQDRSDDSLPFAYLLSRDQSRLADRLLMHGLELHQLTSSTSVTVEVTRHGDDKESSREETWEPGTYVVLLDQPLAPLIPVILEATSPSGWLASGLLGRRRDREEEEYPIRRVPDPVTTWSLEQVSEVRPAERLTLDMIYGPRGKREFGPPLPSIRWLPGEANYLRQLENRWMRVSAENGAARPWYDPESVEKVLADKALLPAEEAQRWAGNLGQLAPRQLSPQGDAVVFSHAQDLYYLRLDGTQGRRLTHSADEERYPTFSPDGRRVAFVRKHNLYVVDVASGTERALTTDGNADHLHGELDWVYQEEIYGRGEFRGFWWSPDSRRLALLVLDQSQVHPHAIADHLAVEQTLEVTRYPKAGATLPSARLAIVEAAGGPLTWVKLPRQGAENLLIVRVGWTPDSQSVVYQLQGREQNWLELLLANPRRGDSRPLLREESDAWVDVLDEPHWLSNERFLWLSQRDGHTRLYEVERKGNQDLPAQPLTPSSLEIRRLHGVDTEGQRVYFAGLREDSVAEQVFALDLESREIHKLTMEDGFHAAQFADNLQYFVDTSSQVHQPPAMQVRRSDGTRSHDIVPVRDDDLRYFDLRPPTFHRIAARDGTLLEAMLIQPPDFDPEQSYPVICYVYGGPQAPTVRDRWGASNYLWHQMLAQQGFCVWLCDNRASSQRGAQSAWPVHGRLGELELQDVEDGVRWLHEQSWVQRDRIGIWGWSYGGYLTSYALTHSQLFRAGIAGAPVTDWHNYDAVYTERLMKMPQNNPEGYRTSSAVQAAENLHGRLLLIHGDADDNVHLGNTLQMVDALHEKGKRFDLMIYPRSLHGVTQPARLRHLREMMTDFLHQHLGSGEPSAEK